MFAAAPEVAVQCFGQPTQVTHQVEELVRQQRLRAVAHRLLRAVVYFHVYAIGTRRHARPAHAGDQIGPTGRVARVHDDRQMALPLHVRHGGQVEHIPRAVLEAAHAAFAQHHLVVAFAQYVLGAHQEVLHRRTHATLE